jgi:ATP:ADP antiporter, AAA family
MNNRKPKLLRILPFLFFKIAPFPRYGIKNFVAMSALMFCILCSQSFLRVLKDSVIISEINVEIIAFIKLYFVLPMAGLFVIFYGKISNKLPYTQIYYCILTLFLAFFLLFAFFLYPNASLIHINNETVIAFASKFPGIKWYALLLGNWSYTLFYVLAELWPDVMYVFLFWQLANRITSSHQAKNLYPMLSFFGNTSVVLTGILVTQLSSMDCWIYRAFSGVESKYVLVRFCVSLLVIIGLFSMYLVHLISVKIVKDPHLYMSKPAESLKISTIEGFKYVTRSRLLWLIVLCSTSFYFGMNLVEVLWKAKIRELHPSVEAYSHLISLCTTWTGVTTMIMNAVGKNLMRYFSWKTIFSISPVIMTISGLAFFLVSVFPVHFVYLQSAYVAVSALQLAVFVGALQSVLAKGVKYSLWDISKEMLYIPLDYNMKTRGKAATDLVGSKLGKALSGLVPVVLLSCSGFANYISMAPIIMVIFVIICGVWFFGVQLLSKEYQRIKSS